MDFMIKIGPHLGRAETVHPELFGREAKMVRRTDLWRRSLWTMAIATVLSLTVLAHYAYFVSPYFPNYADQPNYIWHLYYTYFYGMSGFDHVTTAPKALADLAGFKGWVLEVFGLLAILLFGPSRTSLILANLVPFTCLLLVFEAYFTGLFRRRVGMFAIGLLLLSSSLYMPAGGIEDLRWDFAGLVAFGLTFLAILNLLIVPDRRSLALYVAGALLCLSTRSITGVYLGATMAVAFFLIGSIALFRPASFWGARLRAILLAGVGTGLVVVLQVALFFRSLWAYYGTLVVTDEGRIRLQAADVHGAFGLFRFYLSSLHDHFGYLVLVGCTAILVMSAFVGFYFLACERQDLPIVRPCLLIPGTLAFASTLIGVMLPLSVWNVSPIVIGVMTGPVVALATLAFGVADQSWTNVRARDEHSLHAEEFRRRFDPSLAIVTIVLCLGFANHLLSISRSVGENNLTFERRINTLEAQIADDMAPIGGRISWAVTEDWGYLTVFDIYLCEHGLADLAPHFSGERVGEIGAVPVGTLLKAIRKADAVVAYRSFGAHLTSNWPSVASFERSRGIWQPILDREFVLRSTFAGGADETFGYYLRPVLIKDIAGTSLITVGDRPAFWMNESAVQLHLDNIAPQPREAVISMVADPNVEAADKSRVAVAFDVGGQKSSVETDPAHGWRVEQRVTVPPGGIDVEVQTDAQPIPGLKPGTATKMVWVQDVAVTTHIGP